MHRTASDSETVDDRVSSPDPTPHTCQDKERDSSYRSGYAGRVLYICEC